MTETKPTRRQFFRLAATAIGGAALTACDRTPTATPSPTRPRPPTATPATPPPPEATKIPPSAPPETPQPEPPEIIEQGFGGWTDKIDNYLSSNEDAKKIVKGEFLGGRRVWAVAIKHQIDNPTAQIEILPIGKDFPKKQQDYETQIFYALADNNGEKLVPFNLKLQIQEIRPSALISTGSLPPKTSPELLNKNVTAVIANADNKTKLNPPSLYGIIIFESLPERKDFLLEILRKKWTDKGWELPLSADKPIDIRYCRISIVEFDVETTDAKGNKTIEKRQQFTAPQPEA